MNLKVSSLDGDIKQLALEGHMDLIGSEAIGLKLHALASTERQFFVTDLSKVDFMASIGIGLLVRCVSALRLRGGNMVLLNPQPGVRMVLEKTRIDSVIPIFSDLQEACRVVKEAPPAAP